MTKQTVTKRKPSRKLTLQKDTIRDLTAKKSADALRGGGGGRTAKDCGTVG
jgi:hypothetical protein